MFDKGYKFNLVNKKSVDNDDLLTIFTYNFKGKRRYIALVEEYFIAANSITSEKEEAKYNNKRFQVYRQLMADFFSSDIFAHILNEANSAYLLINRCNKNIDSFTDSAIKMFIENYPDIEV